jgi:hypothetical protein
MDGVVLPGAISFFYPGAISARSLVVGVGESIEINSYLMVDYNGVSVHE